MGHRSIIGLLVQLIRFAVDSETVMEWRFASHYGRIGLIVQKTIADARSSSSLGPRIKEFAGLKSSAAHDQLSGSQQPTAFHGGYILHEDSNLA